MLAHDTPLKRCTKCGRELPATTDFFRRSSGGLHGVQARCIDCTRAHNREYQRRYNAEHPETNAEWRERNHNKVLEKGRRYHAKHRESINARRRARSQADPSSPRASRDLWNEQNPEKVAAYLMVRKAVNRGELIKHPCEVCGGEKAEAHHDDYSRPLDVRWLCRAHHVAHHMKEADRG